MQETAVSFLSGWANFYVIIGSSAAALTGLTFIVITLVAGAGALGRGDGVAAFSTPTVVHFGAALLVAVILAAPWPMLWHISILLGLIGLAGMIYIIVILRRARRQTSYEPVLEDWLWHTIFPFISYAAFFGSAIVLPTYPVPTLFVIAAATVLLLFIGIHNSWDTVTYIVMERIQRENKSED
jgi:hypothetical protein